MRWGNMRREKKHIFFWDEMKCGMWSASVKHEVQGAKGAVWSVKKVFAWRCIAMWSRARHVLECSWTTTAHQVRAKHAFTHGPGWRTVLASSIGEKVLLIKSKATSAPPRAGTSGVTHSHAIVPIMWIFGIIFPLIPIKSLTYPVKSYYMPIYELGMGLINEIVWMLWYHFFPRQNIIIWKCIVAW